MLKSKHRYSRSSNTQGTPRGTILLLSGLAGEGLFEQEVVPVLNDNGFNTMEVGHNRMRGHLEAEKARQIDIHHAAKQVAGMDHATKESARLFAVGYSKGGADAIGYFNWLNEAKKHPNPNKRPTYEIAGYAGVAALGQSGGNIWGVFPEAKEFLKAEESGFVQRLKTCGRVVNNCANLPLVLAETFGCLTFMPSDRINEHVELGTIQAAYSVYGSHDDMVPMPYGWPSDNIFRGSHDSPMSDPSIISDAVDKLVSLVDVDLLYAGAA